MYAYHRLALSFIIDDNYLWPSFIDFADILCNAKSMGVSQWQLGDGTCY